MHSEDEHRYHSYEDSFGTLWTYRILDDECCSIVSLNAQSSERTTLERTAPDNASELIIPEKIEGRSVIALEEKSFISQSNLQKVTLPATLRTIGEKAFAYDSLLESIQLPEGLTEIGAYAFMDTRLTTLDMPSTLKTIKEKAFYHCINLVKVKLDEGLEEIGDGAFSQTSICELRIPSTVTKLGTKVLERSDKHKADKSSTVRLIVDARNSVYLSDKNGTGIYRIDGNNVIFSEYLGNDERYTLLPNTISIAPKAFLNATSLHEVILPDGLISLEEKAFCGCSKLRTLHLPSTLKSIGAYALFSTALKKIVLPANLEMLDDWALVVKDSTFDVIATSPVIEIDNQNKTFFIEEGFVCQRMADDSVRALIYAGGKSDVSISENITRIGAGLLYGAMGIEDLTLHDSIQSFDPRAFFVNEPIQHVRIKLHTPIEGHESLDVYFPDTRSSRQIFIYAFNKGELDIETISYASDVNLCNALDTYDFGRLALKRIIDPIMLSEKDREKLADLVRKELVVIVKKFALHHYHEGFERLVELGFVTRENFDIVMNTAQETEEISSIGYLLEIKHRYLGTSFLDEYDL